MSLFLFSNPYPIKKSRCFRSGLSFFHLAKQPPCRMRPSHINTVAQQGGGVSSKTCLDLWSYNSIALTNCGWLLDLDLDLMRDPKVTEAGIPPLTTLSHCSRQFFSLESGVFCEKVYICCCWSTSGSLTLITRIISSISILKGLHKDLSIVILFHTAKPIIAPN